MGAAIQLNHYLTKLPSDQASSLRRASTFYSVLEKTAWVAFVAITAFVLISSIGAPAAITSAVSIAMIALSFSVLLFAWGAMVFRSWAVDAKTQAGVETEVAKELDLIKDWQEPEVRGFLGDAKVDKTPLEQINKKEPLCALKPIIARITYLEKQAKRIQKSAFEALEYSKKTAKTQEEAEIHFLQRELAAYDLEHRAYPMLFNAAVLWKIIENPAKEDSIENYGSFIKKSHGRRLSDQIYRPGDDHYFVFRDNAKAPISFEAMKDQTPLRLAQEL